jgi:hypothetical protein
VAGCTSSGFALPNIARIESASDAALGGMFTGRCLLQLGRADGVSACDFFAEDSFDETNSQAARSVDAPCHRLGNFLGGSDGLRVFERCGRRRAAC